MRRDVALDARKQDVPRVIEVPVDAAAPRALAQQVAVQVDDVSDLLAQRD